MAEENPPYFKLMFGPYDVQDPAQKDVMPVCEKVFRGLAGISPKGILKAMHLSTQATGPPQDAKPEPAKTEALKLEWSGEGESADWPEYPD